ncbi:hypothetical protein [Vibrio phage BX-1]|nr:hypothetical protein [Vibrio phage BX-1]
MLRKFLLWLAANKVFKAHPLRDLIKHSEWTMLSTPLNDKYHAGDLPPGVKPEEYPALLARLRGTFKTNKVYPIYLDRTGKVAIQASGSDGERSIRVISMKKSQYFNEMNINEQWSYFEHSPNPVYRKMFKFIYRHLDVDMGIIKNT